MSAAAAGSRPLSLSAPVAAWKPKRNPWVIALTVTLATFMEVLDTSIANVALPHIAGGLGASQDEATWVLTSYLVANAVILPASAYFTTFIGRKRLYMICVALFGISSAMCGLAPSLPLLIFFRVLQGVGGGGLAPSEQAILADTFPPEKRGQAFALYGLAVVFAPAIGPTLGGWITDNFDWRWIFFINVPVAILSLFLTSRIVEDPPHLVQEVKKTQREGLKLDFIGFALLALAFGSLELIMDKGQEDDWFGSHLIATFAVVCAVSMISLIAWELVQIRRKKAYPRPHALQASKLCGVVFAHGHFGHGLVRHHGADSAICAVAPGVHRRAGRPRHFTRRHDGHVDDADRGFSGQPR
jgi:DHA2 family multidrug resistance protein